MCQVVRGDGWVRVRGVEHRTPPGTLFLIPPGEVHSNDTEAEGCDFRSMLVKEESIRQLGEDVSLSLNRGTLVRQPVITSNPLTRRYRRWHRAFIENRNRLHLESELGEILDESLRTLSHQSLPAVPDSIGRAVNRAREILWDECHLDINLSELSRRCGMSPFELSRQFKAAYGLPPHAWMIQGRIDGAKRLLRDGLRIADVAQKMGFADQPHLTRHFRKVTGITPGRSAVNFRKNIQDR